MTPMVSRKPYHTPIQRVLRSVSWCAVLMTTVVVLTPTSLKQKGSPASLIFSGNAPLASKSWFSGSAQQSAKVLPTILNEFDIAQYNAIFTAQKAGDWITADDAIATLDNKLLLGYVLADRYLNRKYNSTAEELAEWLNTYSDHPQAPDIYKLALAKMPSLKKDLPLVRKERALDGYGDDNGLAATRVDEAYAHYWRDGLQAWKNGNKEEAAKQFAAMADHKKDMSPWVSSAASYWAYRSFKAVGNHASANTYLRQAANYSRCFYGILARKQLKLPLELDTKPVALTEDDALQMVGDQSIRRVVALTETGLFDLAEKELRARFLQADDIEQARMLAVAHELGLASVQISMAKRMSSGEREFDFARYPVPSYQPEGGYTVDPLLMYSLIRQESGFRTSAVSPAGAMGLMQLMPKTASLMHKKVYGDEAQEKGNAAEPIVNITLGQNYVAHLLSNNLVDNNMVYLLTAYNAGPGRLQEWKKTLGNGKDPLLFIESIPIGQTRNYVMQVLTNYWIYSELVGNSNGTITALLQNKWPSYEAYAGPLAENMPKLADNNNGV